MSCPELQKACKMLCRQDYLVQYRDNLRDGNWTALGGIIPGTGSPLTFSAAVNSNSHRFFRLLAHKRPQIVL